jgi:hypothetical protein
MSQSCQLLDKGNFVCVYWRQGKLEKCKRNTSMVLANKRRPLTWDINRFNNIPCTGATKLSRLYGQLLT